MKKTRLAILLSKLHTFEKPKAGLEQYSIDSQSASEILWNSYQLGDIEGKNIADLGCGTGILGIGALLLGAKKCFFVDKDARAVRIAKNNLLEAEKAARQKLSDRAIFLIGDIEKFKKEVHTVIQNPPFGTKQIHADTAFLEKALEIAKVVYSVHKTVTSDFIKKFTEKRDAAITHSWKLELQLKPTMAWHKMNIYRPDVECIRIEKIKKR